MYLQHFGLKQAPFSIAPDPHYLYMSERHREALAHLLYGVNGGGGFVLLTGEIGAGKTTVCRCFLEQIPRRCNVAYIFNPKLTVVELLQAICEEFRIPCRAASDVAATVKDYVDPLNEFLLKTHAVGQNNVLIIDEAQNLSADVLEQLRLLTNLETSERKLLQIVLIGQPELRGMLARPELEQLAQRVIARFHLAALSEAETAQYIQHRLSVAGLKRGRLFDSASVRRIHQLSKGVPRRINLLCDRALLGAYVEGLSRVERRIVDKAAAEVLGEDNLPSSPLDGQRLKAWWQRRWLQLAEHHWGWTALGVGGALVLAAAGIATWGQGAHPSSAAVANAAASVPATAASTAASPAVAPTPLRLSSAQTVLDDAWASAPQALSALATLWGTSLPAGDPCTVGTRQHLMCFKSSGGLPQLTQLDRPAVLTLMGPAGAERHALLTHLDDTHAVLQTADTTHTVSLQTLATMWRGDFQTYWRTPQGYRTKVAQGQQGPVVDWIATQLARVDGAPLPPAPRTFDDALQARVQSFQLAQGLTPDGVVGATTFMLINRAAGLDEPRLDSTPANPTRN